MAASTSNVCCLHKEGTNNSSTEIDFLYNFSTNFESRPSSARSSEGIATTTVTTSVQARCRLVGIEQNKLDQKNCMHARVLCKRNYHVLHLFTLRSCILCH